MLILNARYQGPCNVEGMKAGLLLSEANCGDLQSFIENDDNKVNDTQRILWSFQLAQALGYVHTKGVLHWNISATNVLLHRTGQRIDAILADFGGSRCQELGIDGALLPDDPYLDPRLDSFDSPKTDIFSLGVIFYYIMTGHYPFHGRPAPQEEEKWLYGSRVQGLYKDGKFPDVSSILLGDVIAGCCYERRFETVEEVVVAIKANIGIGAAPVR
jgi:serine/threonine protein kinase